MRNNYLLKHSLELSKKHPGKHVAMVGNKIIAIGKTFSEAYKKAIKDVPKGKKLGVFYLPTKDEILVAL